MKQLAKWLKQSTWILGFAALGMTQAYAAPADDVIFDMSQKILKDLKNDAGLRSGNKATVSNYVDANIMPHVDFARWTASAVGPKWNSASGSEQSELMQVLRRYFVSTYSSSLVRNTVDSIDVYPANGSEVKTIVKHKTGKQDKVVYSMANSGGSWKAYDVSINGIKASNTYRGQFKNTVNKGGVAALIVELKAKTK